MSEHRNVCVSTWCRTAAGRLWHVTAPDHLTPTLQRALAAAAEDARGRGHRHLGTGHLLMGVLGVPDAPGAAVLGRLGVLLHYVDAEIVRVAGYGERDPGNVPEGVSPEDVFGTPGTPRRRWFARSAPIPTSAAAGVALRYAGTAGGAAIGTQHLVRGLLESEDGLARHILAAHGVTVARLRQSLATLPP